MNESILKLLPRDRKKAALLAAGVIGVVLLAISSFIPASGSESTSGGEPTKSVSDYAKQTEARLTKVLESISGAGDIRVMITYECGSESVYAENKDNRHDGQDESVVRSEKSEYALVDYGSTEDGLLLYVREPKVKGVAVVCEGGASPQVRKAITDAVTALFGIGENRVSVAKMNKNPEE